MVIKEKPNVVIINCDDLGYGDLGCYGSTINKSPFVDKLAAQGVRFTSFYCASPVCSPSRAGLLTGCYPARVGIDRVLFPGEPYGLNPNEFTMPRLFKNAGYATALVGKWHCGDQQAFLPHQFGFDEYYGLPYSNDMGMRVNMRKPIYPPLPLVSGDRVIEEQPDQRGLTERYVEKCVEFVRKHRQERFFLYFAQMHVHLPLYAAERFVNESENGDFGACVASLDWACGAIFHELEKLHLLENTLIVFTSDNGARGDYGSCNLPLKGGKVTTWEGGQRIPFILYWKGKFKPGVNCQMASQIDLLPTFAAMLGQDIGMQTTDGLDLTDMLFHGSATPRKDFVYYNQHRQLEAVRKGNWKLHVYKNKSPVALLYNLESDISESHNLYPDYPETVQELTELYEQYRAELGDSITGVTGSAVRTCGYVEHPLPLTQYDERHPYIVALYDKDDVG